MAGLQYFTTRKNGQLHTTAKSIRSQFTHTGRQIKSMVYYTVLSSFGIRTEEYRQWTKFAFVTIHKIHTINLKSCNFYTFFRTESKSKRRKIKEKSFHDFEVFFSKTAQNWNVLFFYDNSKDPYFYISVPFGMTERF